MRRPPHDWLAERTRLTCLLYEHPYDLILYLNRARTYTRLGYPDLAAGDAYRALLLADEVREETGEHHEEAVLALSDHCDADFEMLLSEETLKCYRILASSLLKCGCLKSAWDFCARGLALFAGDVELLKERGRILSRGRVLRKQSGGRPDNSDGDGDIHPNDLPDQGFARREVYPWNTHEPDRFSKESLDFLNREMAKVAPKCEVKATFLPSLQETTARDNSAPRPPRKQLGVFAKETLAPGETVLRETSLLTVNNRLHGSFCDACSTRLPDITTSTAQTQVSACPDCDDTFFCNDHCLQRALETYHPAVCGCDVEAVGKEVDRKEASGALYLLLLARVFAMAETTGVHPLELREVKFLWGDFVEVDGDMQRKPATSGGDDDDAEASLTSANLSTLPFTFSLNIALPLHLLQKLSLNPYTALATHDPWIHNTVFSKLRSTASARLSPHDGTPEVSAVHPLWCLANHDCDPNVRWEWGGEIRFWVRESRVGGRAGGVEKGEEILGHYCDVGLGVGERRDWAMGSLGGWCMCERCRREEAEEVGKGLSG